MCLPKAKSVTIADEVGVERGGNEPQEEEEGEEEEEEPLTFKQQLERQLGGKCHPQLTSLESTFCARLTFN